MSLRFDDSFVRALPADPVQINRVRQVPGAAYSRVAPTPVARPRVAAVSRAVAAMVGLADADWTGPELAEVFAGNRLMPGMVPYAANYGGHQFGAWAGQLGDGRAITLGEVLGPDGRRLELQLKGAGRTPYSRTADGRAVMRSSVREFLCSEAMFHLGVPTTRALCLVDTGEQVVRDMFYDGNPRPEPGAVVTRVAPSFVRFGNFEIFAARRELDILRALADWVIRTHFPELGEPGPDVYGRWFSEICRRTATLMVHWMRVGFVHGVMNTDNMSILGLTIDYGPYGWLEGFDPTWTPNTTDAGGRRYRYGNQPRVAHWNLAQLASALVPLVGDPAPLQEAIDAYPRLYESEEERMLASKLGLPDPHRGLTDDLGQVLQLLETDMTLFYRALADVPLDGQANDDQLLAPLAGAYYVPAAFGPVERTATLAWLHRYRGRVQAIGLRDEQRRGRMKAVNPKYVLRNYLAQLAIDEAERGEYRKIDELLEVLRRPYDEQPGRQEYTGKRPEWARNRAGCSMLSCSS